MSDFRKPWERSEFRSSSDRPPRPGFKKPWEKRGGDDRPPRREGSFRKPWEKREDGDRPPRREGTFRKPWEARPEGGAEGGGEERRPFRPARRSEGFGGTFRRKPWESPDGRAPPRPPRSGFRKPWEDRAEGGEERPRRPWQDRGARSGEGRPSFGPHRKPRAAAIPAEGELV